MADVITAANSLVSLVGSGAGTVDKVLDVLRHPLARTIVGFLPYGSTVMAGIDVAAPYIEKVAAGAPVVATLIEQGRPIVEAIEKAGPDMLPGLKSLYAIATGTLPVGKATPELVAQAAAKVSDQQAIRFAGPALFGRAWTREEEERWFDRASAIENT